LGLGWTDFFVADAKEGLFDFWDVDFGYGSEGDGELSSGYCFS